MAGTVSATIRLNDAFSGTLSKLKSGLSGGASAMNRLSSMGNSTGGMFKSVLGGTVIGNGITKGIGMIGTGLRSMYSELDESSRAWQTFNGNMAMLGKSPAQIASTRGDLQKFAQQTIYSASDMASTYSQLAAVGTKSTGKLVKGFGGLAAASSDPQQAMKTLSQQATQAAAKPKIQWADFKLMLEQTPAGMAAVAKTMHRSTGQLVKDVQAGKIKTQDFFNAIAKTGTNANFSKMATQYKTIGQAMDGLRETAANKLQPAFDAVGKVGISAVSKLMGSFDNINANKIASQVTPIAKSVVSGITSAVKLIGNAMKGISKMDPSVLKNLGLAFVALKAGTSGLALGAIVGSLKLLGTLKPSTLNSLAKALTALAIALIIFKAAKGIAGVIGGIVGAFKSLGSIGKTKVPVPDGTAAGKSAVGFLKLGAALLMVGGAVALTGAGFYLIAKAATMLTSAGWPAIAMFAAMIVVIVAIAIAASLLAPALLAGGIALVVFGAGLLLVGLAVFLAAAGMALLATQLPVIATFGLQAALNIAILGIALSVFGALALIAAIGITLLGVSLIILAVGLVVAAVGAFIFAAAMLLVFVSSMLAFVGLALVFVGSMLAFVGLLLVMVGSLMAMVGLMMVMIGSIMAFVGLMMVMIGGILAMVGLMMVMIGGIMAMVGLMMVMIGSIMAMVGLMMVGMMAILAGVGLMMLGVMAMMASVGMMLLATATTMVATRVAKIASSAASAASSLTGMVSAVNVIKTGLDSLKSAATSAVTGFVSALRAGVGNARSAGHALASAATSGMKSGVGPARSAGVMIGAGLAAGLRSQIGAVRAAASALANAAASAARAAAKVHSPSRVFAEIGGYMGQGLANGMNDTTSIIANAGSRMAHAAINSANVVGLNPGDLLADGFNRAYAAVNNVVGAMRGLGGSPLAVNGQMNMNPATAVPSTGDALSSVNSGVISTTPFTDGVTPYTTSNSTATTQNNAGNSITIAPGAIQISSTGNAKYDIETLVSEFEDYLMNLNERKG